MSLFQKLLRAGEGRKLKTVESIVPLVNRLEPEMEARSDDELRGLTDGYRQRVAEGEPIDDLLPEAFATVREGAKRVLGQRHFDVQLMGGAALHFGWVAEMKTGEGKTLVATLPVYLNALNGKGVHIVTVNDYLASRDAEWMGRVYKFLGLSVGLVVPDMDDPAHKRAMYAADVTYGTNNEFGFDYLRDNMAISLEDQVQRGHPYAIVDEVDSILIDEARTPLIISGRADIAADLYYQFARVTRSLARDIDYEVDEPKRTVVPTEEGVEKVEKALGVANLYENVNQNFVHQLQAALRAKELFKRDVDYIVQNGEVKIVDEFTGRILEGRRWSEGLHQAVEAKEGVRIKEENQTLATVTLQNYFRLYEKLAGMTGTALTEAGEFAHTYALEVVSIPTHRPLVREDESDLIYKSEEGKFRAAAEDIAERHKAGQPVLVGTISVERSEKLSRLLDSRGIPHEVLNAKQHEREAGIITQAGRPYAVTVATNMAGRGVDILLGGNPEGLAHSTLVSEGDPENTQRYEQLLAEYQKQCAEEGEEVRKLGGLYVLGTERHESRRIDNQLRGRSGRQGDPGETRFYLSLEDDLMRLFATGLVSKVMDRTFPEDMPLEAKMVTRAIERAQRTVEDRNFEIRKDVLKYDEVMNEQRKIIYKRRQQILDGSDLHAEVLEGIESAAHALAQQYCGEGFPEEWDLEALASEAGNVLRSSVTVEDLQKFPGAQELGVFLAEDALSKYREKENVIGEDRIRDLERRVVLSVIDQHWREHLYEMDYLREGINLRAMGQRDPLSEWQSEGFNMFEMMIDSIERTYVTYLMRLEAIAEQAPQLQQQAAVSGLQYSAPESPVEGAGAIATVMTASPEQVAAAAGEVSHDGAAHPVHVEKTPGRNDPCYCGSGKKFKHCHGR